jgi:hypothetical protein
MRSTITQIGDVEIQSQAKKFKTAETQFFSSLAISRMFQILQTWHFSTSNISGKGKSSRRVEAASQAVEKIRIYPPPSGLSENQKRPGAGAPPGGLVGQKPRASASLVWN